MSDNKVNSYKELFQQLEEKIVLTDKEKESIPSFFETKKLQKKEYLIQQGDYCKL